MLIMIRFHFAFALWKFSWIFSFSFKRYFHTSTHTQKYRLTFPPFSHFTSGVGVPSTSHSKVTESPSQHLISFNPLLIDGTVWNLLHKNMRCWNNVHQEYFTWFSSHPLFCCLSVFLKSSRRGRMIGKIIWENNLPLTFIWSEIMALASPWQFLAYTV